MYKKVYITENTLQVLSLFTDGYDREYYIREVGKALKISPRGSQLILEDLEEKGVLVSISKGKIRLFNLKNNDTSKRYLLLTEQYKAIAFLENIPLIKEIISKISSCINGIGLIFGSYAKGIEKKGSDLDIFVAGSYDEQKIRKISNMFNIDINVKCYPMEIFQENWKNDIFLREILKNHVIFLGAEEFIDSVLKYG